MNASGDGSGGLSFETTDRLQRLLSPIRNQESLQENPLENLLVPHDDLVEALDLSSLIKEYRGSRVRPVPERILSVDLAAS